MARKLRAAYVPLDDRPVNLDAVHMLAELGGVDLLVPPLELLGSFTEPGDPDAIAGWLLALPPEITTLIVSLDMLCHGGLLASRRPPSGDDSEAAGILARLEALAQLKARRHRLEVLALGVLLRTSISVTGERDLDTWKRVHDVASSREATPDRLRDLLTAEGLTLSLAEAYIATRHRNLDVARQAVRLVQRQVIDYLLLCQEDAAPCGIHVHEQGELQELVAGLGLSRSVSVQPGADEGGMMLLARAALRHHSLGLAVQPRFGPAESSTVPIYEDRAVGRSLELKLETLGGKTGFGTPLWVQVAGDSSDLFLMQRADALPAPPSQPPAAPRAGWAVADVTHANGADPHFMGALFEQVGPLELASFAAWNTASNSLGTVLAHRALYETGMCVLEARELAAAHLAFLATRFADDFLYQSVLRRQLLERARELGLSEFDLGVDGWATMQAALDEEMPERFATWFDRAAARGNSTGFDIAGVRARFSLPWPRLFEVRARVRVELK